MNILNYNYIENLSLNDIMILIAQRLCMRLVLLTAQRLCKRLMSEDAQRLCWRLKPHLRRLSCGRQMLAFLERIQKELTEP